MKKALKISLKSKQILSLSLSVILFLTACGGGGASSSISGATRPQIPSTPSPSTPSPSTPLPFIAATAYSLATKSSSFYTAAPNGTDNYNDENKKTSIGIMDGYFSEVKNTVAKNITMLSPDIQPSSGGEGHGSRVATIIARNSSTTKLYAYDGGDPASDDKLNLSPGFYTLMANRGATVFNNSLGTDPTKDLDNIQHARAALYTPLKNMAVNGDIFVFAAGNESSSYANDESSLPMLYPEAKVGWISVTSVDEKNKFSSDYANQLGRAKNWGIAALGTHSGFLQDSQGLTKGQGTSFAAPVVSAVVAKIWDKFPWMDNHLVTQTLLSTADKYDTRANKKTNEVTTEPNDIVGWGVLNETRALKGPARFDKKLLINNAEQVEVRLDYRNYNDKDKLTFSNDIAGDAGLKKSGTGTLYLSGTNTYSGKTTLEGGSLELTGGGLKNSEVEIKSGAKLTINGKSVQAGKSINNQGGILEIFGEGTTITDSYSSSNSAKLVLDLTKASLKVSSKLDLTHTSFIVDVRTMDGINGGQNSKQIVSANEITGFSQYQLSNNANAWLNLSEFKYNNKEFLVSYSRNPSTKALQNLSFVNANTLNTAKNFDNLLKDLEDSNEATPIYQAALNVLNSTTPKAAISSLSGEIHSANNALLARQNTMLNHALSQRLNTLREQGQNGVWTSALSDEFKSTSKAFANADATTNALLFGSDTSVDALKIGFVLLQGKMSANFDKEAGNNEAKNHYIGLYSSYDFEDFYVAGNVNAGLSRSKFSRMINNAEAKSEYDTKLYNFYAELGKDFSHHNAIFTPFAGLLREQMQREGFDEKIPLGLSAKAKNYALNSLVAGLHSRVLFDGLEFGMGFKHQLLLNPSDFGFEAKFSKMSSPAYIKTARQDRNLSFVGFKSLFDLSENLKLDVGYDFSLRGLKKSENHLFNVGLGYFY